MIVSYFEWVQNIQSLIWDIDQVDATLKKILLTAFDGVYNLKKEKDSSMRMAAYMVAIRRLCTAGKLRGGPISFG